MIVDVTVKHFGLFKCAIQIHLTVVYIPFVLNNPHCEDEVKTPLVLFTKFRKLNKN